MSTDGRLAVLGATGYTGGLVVEEARGLGLPLRLVGRRPSALAALARPGDEIRVADARDERALREAFAGAAVVASCAGPFLALGVGPVAAAIAVGAHYLDTSAEQPFARLVYERFGAAAEAQGLTLLTAFGFDYVVGDLAARLAAKGLGEVDEVAVAYATPGFFPSRGTRRTAGEILRQPVVAWSGGALVPSRFGATTRRIRFPAGMASAVEWWATEPLTVPRHTPAREVRSYLCAPRIAASAGRVAPLAAPLLVLSARVGAAGPSAKRRAKGRFAVVAEVRGSAAGRRATVVGSNVYGLTARLVASGARAVAQGQASGAGARAPAEAFAPDVLVEWLEGFLRVESIEAL